MEPLPDYIDVAVMLAVGGLSWRPMASLDRRTDGWLADLARDVCDVDRRLARLEGRPQGREAFIEQIGRPEALL